MKMRKKALEKVAQNVTNFGRLFHKKFPWALKK